MVFRRLCGKTTTLWGFALAVTGLCFAIYSSIQPLPTNLTSIEGHVIKQQVMDRANGVLSYTFASGWNISDRRPLHRIPLFLIRAFIESEDQRFYTHQGVDWSARAHAAWQNLRAARGIRGASTISEQVVRMLHPRSRSPWSRVIEGIEAGKLESRFTKSEILEFYLNQVPYAANRRGVAQAARHFWDRDLETLTEKELLALVVMVRAPERLEPVHHLAELETRIASLAKRLRRLGLLTEEELQIIREAPLTVTPASNLPVRVDHFVRYVNSLSTENSAGGIVTTLDISIQQRAQAILEERVSDLLTSNVSDGAILIVDNTTAEVLAWVNAGEFGQREESQIDAVITPRQPGSTLKPLLYAHALGKGWNASTLIDDSPLLLAVGAGLHTYRNYSRVHYGDISVREALGNSLNIPAIRAIQFVGKEDFLHFLRRAGFTSLSRTSDYYGEGLALGNGEVTLFELVQSYTALANQGVWRPLRVLREEKEESLRPTSLPLISPEVASIISDILSDPYARRREFGVEGLLRFPIQTAIKTGTSSDFRDAWAIGYSDRYTVGVWMGNLNRASMNQISGARGPALVLRSIFSELHRTIDSKGLFLARSIRRHTICTESGHLASSRCPQREELFVPGTEPTLTCNGSHKKNNKKLASLSGRSIEDPKIVMPTPGLNVARDPRIPDNLEALPIEVAATGDISEVSWYVDGMRVSRTGPGKLKYLWPLVEGRHTVRAEVIRSHEAGVKSTSEVAFWVR